MSRRSIAWRKRFNQAVGNDYAQGGRTLDRIFIRDDNYAIDLLIPTGAKGKKSGKRCTAPMDPDNEVRLRKLLQSEGKGARR